MKRLIAFGMLAASLAIAPGAAFAGSNQVQSNDQLTNQSGAAFDGGTNVQNSRTDNNQSQNARNTGGRRGYGYGRYYGGSKAPSSRQEQRSVQTTDQDGVGEYGGTNVQNSNTDNNQRQNAHNRRR